MLLTIRNLLIAFALGAILGGLGSLWVLKKYDSIPPDQVKVTPISGERISHSDFRVNRQKVSFITTAEGKGKISTEFPVTAIPQAKAWIERIDGIEASVYLMYQSGKIYPYYGITYWRRFGSFSLGGGAVFSPPMTSKGIFESPGSFGLRAGVMYWF